MDDRRTALLFKAFGDENRIRILELKERLSQKA